MRGIIRDRLLDEHMFAFCQESVRYRVVRISWRCHGSGIDHLNKFVERFGRYRTEFPTDGAAPEMIHVIHCGELGRWNFRIQPRMVAPDVTNPNNSDAQVIHHRSQSTRKAIRVNPRLGPMGHINRKNLPFETDHLAQFARNHS